MTPTKEQMQAAREDLSKVDYHPRSVDDGHYDAGYDQEQAGAFLDKHIKTVYAVLTPPEPAESEVAEAIAHAEIIIRSRERQQCWDTVKTLKNLISAVTRLEAEKKAAVEGLEKIFSYCKSKHVLCELAHVASVSKETLAKLGVK